MKRFQGDSSLLSGVTENCRFGLEHLIATIDKFITLDRIRNYSIIFVALGLLAAGVDSLTRVMDPSLKGALLNDFMAHWTGGHLVLSSDAGSLYDPWAQRQVQSETLGTSSIFYWYVSLPIVAVLYAPLAAINYNLSAILWLILNVTLLIWCIRSTKSLAPKLFQKHSRLVFLAVLASAPALEIFGSGQDTPFMLAAWLIGIKLLTSRRQAAAGAVLGLATLKPQHAVLIPFILLATRRYKALVAFSTVGAVVLASSFLLVGVDGIRNWISTITSPAYNELVQQGQAWKMMSIPAFVLEVLPPAWSAWLAPNIGWLSVLAALAVLLICLRGRRDHTPDAQAVWVATLATTMIFSSHLLLYDAMMFVPVAIFLIERRPSAFLRVVLLASFALMWSVNFNHLLASHASWPLTIVQAPWSVLPLTALWIESLKEVLGQRPRLNGLRPSALRKGALSRLDTD